MIELPLDYMNELASQTFFISALLGGFSLTVLVLLLDNDISNKLMTAMFKVSAVATGAFLITIFAMTNIVMTTTEGYPFKIVSSDLDFARTVGVSAFLIGIISVITIMALAGWTKSKRLGRFTTVVGVITLIFVLMMLG